MITYEARVEMLENMLKSVMVRLEDAETLNQKLLEMFNKLTKEVDERLILVEDYLGKEFHHNQALANNLNGGSSTREGSPIPNRAHSPRRTRPHRHRESNYRDSPYSSEDDSDDDLSQRRRDRIPVPPPASGESSNERVSDWLEKSVNKRGGTRRGKRISQPRATPTARGGKRAKPSRRNNDEHQGSDNPVKCHVCKKYSRRACEVCKKYICADHRLLTIQCPDYNPAVRDCCVGGHPVSRSPSNATIGRCVSCPGGKNRKPSRTMCQTCKRFICAEHQQKHIRCPDHRNDLRSVRSFERESVDRSRSPSGFGDSEFVDQIYP